MPPRLDALPAPLQRALPYLVPYGLFALLTYAADALPGWRGEIYLLKTLAVAAALWAYRRAYTELQARWSPALPVAALVGVLVIIPWVALDPYTPQNGAEWRALLSEGPQRFEHPEKVAGQFNPYEASGLLPPALVILVRVLGAVLVVPVFEELFWRSLLIRWLIRDDFRSVPMGTYSLLSFAVTVAAFGFTHHEWLAGILCGAAFNGLLYWRRDLFACVVAHAAANAALAAWVLTQGAWQFW